MDRTALVMLLVALLSLVVAGVFAPQTAVGPQHEPVSVGREVTGWLWRLAAFVAEPAGPEAGRSEITSGMLSPLGAAR